MYQRIARHEIELPQRILVGNGVIAELGRIMRSLGLGGPVAVVAGPNVWKTYGEGLRGSLEGVGYEYEYFEARSSSVEWAEELAREVSEYGAGSVVGFGGGKSIDLAKFVGHRVGVPVVSAPTSASHDGIASPFTSLRGLNRPYSVRTVTPTAIVADTSIIARAPVRLLRAGSGDLAAKLTAVRDWRLAHKLKGEYYGEYAAKLALLSARHVLAYSGLIRAGGPEAIRIVVEGLISSGVAMCIAGSTRPASGSEHLFAHAVEMLAPGKALHGELTALGTIMMMYLHGGKWRRVKRALANIGLPVRARELGLSDEVVVEALTMAHKIRPERYTVLGESGLTREAAENLARVTGVIG